MTVERFNLYVAVFLAVFNGWNISLAALLFYLAFRRCRKEYGADPPSDPGKASAPPPRPLRLFLCAALVWAALAFGSLLLVICVFHLRHFATFRLCSNVVFFQVPACLALLTFTHVRFLRQRQPRASRAEFRAAMVPLCLALIFMAVYVRAALVEPHDLQVNTHRIQSEKLAGLERPIRIVVIADPQTDRVGNYERRAFRTAMDQKPDILLMLGDYVQLPFHIPEAREYREFNQMLLDLDVGGKYGAFALEGDVEQEDWYELQFQGTRIRKLNDEVVKVPLPGASATIVGLSRLASRGLPDWLRELLSQPTSDLRIVIGHAPDFMLECISGQTADLCLSGHTHGGQVQLPFIGPLVTFTRAPKKVAAGGLHRFGDTYVCVSRGVGMERNFAPRLRFLCRPEIVVIELSGPPHRP